MKNRFILRCVLAVLTTFLGISPALAERLGTVEVYSDPPGAKVYINNIFVGRTPYRNEEMPLGSHRIRAVLSEDLPSASWEGVIDGVGPETIRFSFEKTRALDTPPVSTKSSVVPPTAAPSEIGVPSVGDTGDNPPAMKGSKPGVPVENGNPWGILDLRANLVGTPPIVRAEKCYVNVSVELPVALDDLKDGNFFLGDFQKRSQRHQFAYHKPDQMILHTWDDNCREIEYDSASLMTAIRPGEYQLKLLRRIKTRTLKFGVVPDDDMVYKLADRETITVLAGKTTRVTVTVNVQDGTYTVDTSKTQER